jgi:beta-N-acetylglucosaminidase
MTEKLDPQQTYDFKELLIAEMIEIDTITQLLIEKGIITQQEYLSKLKQVQHEYEKRRRS